MPLICETEHTETRNPLYIKEFKSVYFSIVHNIFPNHILFSVQLSSGHCNY